MAQPRTPIEMYLDGLAWKTSLSESEIEKRQEQFASDGILYATHEGQLEIFGSTIRCYQLNDGQRVFDADDLARIVGGMTEADDGDTVEVSND